MEEDNLTIDIVLNGVNVEFDARLISHGYTYKIVTIVNGMEVNFEPDENREYRAIVDTNIVNKISDKDRTIIGLIAERLNSVMK